MHSDFRCGSAADGLTPAPAEHRSVLCDEAMLALQVSPGGIYVDATFGRGGHARQILRRLGSTGRLYALDRDLEAERAARRLTDIRFTMIRERFSRMKSVCAGLGILGRVQGLLLDIGVSGPQLDDPGRGFSFRSDGPLDMRMDQEQACDAAQLVNRCSAAELERIFREYGEERHARRVARAIARSREGHPITTTAELRAIVERTVPYDTRATKHRATRVFQALRIAVNQELEELRAVLEDSPAVLAPGGVLAVISFHSLEDRMVKHFMRRGAADPALPQGLPLTQEQIRARGHRIFEEVRAPVRPGESELHANPRARSAVLRSAVRAAER